MRTSTSTSITITTTTAMSPIIFHSSITISTVLRSTITTTTTTIVSALSLHHQYQSFIRKLTSVEAEPFFISVEIEMGQEANIYVVGVLAPGRVASVACRLNTVLLMPLSAAPTMAWNRCASAEVVANRKPRSISMARVRSSASFARSGGFASGVLLTCRTNSMPIRLGRRQRMT